MSEPVFHPALDGVADELEAMREEAARFGVTVEQFAFCLIHEAAAILVRNGSSSQHLHAAMSAAYAERVEQVQ
jgi:hypothetical protein